MRWSESWEVCADSDAGKIYVVSRDEEGNFGCSCPAWTKARNRARLTSGSTDCKHIRRMRGRLLIAEAERAAKEQRKPPTKTEAIALRMERTFTFEED